MAVKNESKERQYVFEGNTINILNQIAMLTDKDKTEIVNESVLVYGNVLKFVHSLDGMNPIDLIPNLMSFIDGLTQIVKK